MWIDALKRMKKNSGMTTAEIAEKSGVPEPTLEKLFAGKTKSPTLPTLSKVVHLFGYTLDDLEKPPGIEKEKSPAPAEAETEDNTKWLTDLLVARGYIRTGEDISDRDAAFLTHWIGVLDAWFEK